MEKISIIVPVYNTSPYLEKCLDSLVNQTYKNIEIICVNDGSTDNSAEILHRYAEKYSNFIAIDQENQGVSAARNTALAKADGDYLMFVDSDDWVDHSICEKLLTAIRVNNAECAMCSYVKEYEYRSIVNHVFTRDFCLKGEKFKRFFYRRLFGLVGKETRNPQNIDLMVSVWMQLFRADLCEGIQFVDLNKIGSAEDCLYQMMVYKNCNTFAYIDEPLYHYRKTNQSSLTTKFNSQLFDRWLCLYDMMEGIINENGYPDIYRRALNNRVCFGLIGLGLNEVRAKKSFVWKNRRFHQICSTKRYSAALRSLKLKHLSFPWKVFYGAMKIDIMFPVVIMLEIIETIRTHRAVK